MGAYGEGSPPYKRFSMYHPFVSVTNDLAQISPQRNFTLAHGYFGPHLELNEEDNARSVASPCSESCHGIITEQHSQSREKIRGARGTQAFAAHGMIDDPRNHGRTEHPRSCERSILPRGPANTGDFERIDHLSPLRLHADNQHEALGASVRRAAKTSRSHQARFLRACREQLPNER